MAERPILFSGAMVRAILEGRKSQTRRVVKLIGAEVIEEAITGPWPFSPQHDDWIACPYGRPGDRLWVRETHAFLDKRDPSGKRVAYAAGPFLWGNSDPKTGVTWPPPENSCDAVRVPRWRPSIHMPRWASRITLEATGVRVERLNDITEEDAKAEGVEAVNGHPERGAFFGVGPCHREGFAQVWADLNGAGSWKANPWVWAITFKRVTP